ncbi:hypothetical protein TpMuguga_03g00169 [Theileria parva strain Muguga]|uniref:Uncharacterized protein n=1 Tax=Theileria parva TaxID=5875 RepID=Q4N0X7_THEPA|nr:uncharacterized protein TpMuguga_03g00169 [Theileria parva strain Muguga]EAN30904.1 hypothetical protein TpMuguga_03g00169 [Theileria parva strain Muguga]|eukprot:XP_763187.1 hypothetical protein [Theileria parva strain Muguga]
MSWELLGSRLHIDQVDLWNQVGKLLEESALQTGQKDCEVTSEYYVWLISRILEEVKKKPSRDSKAVQTEEDSSDPEIECLMKELEMENKILEECYEQIPGPGNYYKEEDLIIKVCCEGDSIIWENTENLIKLMKFREDKCVKKCLSLLKKRNDLYRKIIAAQYLSIVSLKHIHSKNKNKEFERPKFKATEEIVKLEKRIEDLKGQNQNLSSRLELYKSEIEKFYPKNNSSSQNEENFNL